jgi:hypothetical protein
MQHAWKWLKGIEFWLETLKWTDQFEHLGIDERKTLRCILKTHGETACTGRRRQGCEVGSASSYINSGNFLTSRATISFSIILINGVFIFKPYTILNINLYITLNISLYTILNISLCTILNISLCTILNISLCISWTLAGALSWILACAYLER